MSQSPSVAQELKQKEAPLAPAEYSKDQMEARAMWVTRIKRAVDQRGAKHEFFDGLDYYSDYILNQQARNTYLRPKLNDDEVRVNTGTTEKKLEAVLNEVLSMNFQHEIRAFDQEDKEVVELGNDLGDAVTRTNRLENNATGDNQFWVEAYTELLTQRAVFIWEKCVPQVVRDKRKGGKVTKYEIKRAEKHLVSGLKVYLEDMTIPAYKIDTQPGIFVVERMTHKEASTIYSKFPNWKYVRKGMSGQGQYTDYFEYRATVLQEEEVEIIHCMDYPNDEYQVIINGVDMLPVGTKLPREHEGYPIRMHVLKSMSPEFAYGKPLTASAKTLQALENETIRNMIRKFRQGIEPPTGVRKGKVFSKDIWAAGSLVQGATKEDFSKLIDHDGLTSSEYQFMEMVRRMTEEFVGASNVMQGLPSDKKITATEVIQIQKQAIKMLGLVVLAVMRMHSDMALMRVYTILEEYTKPVNVQFDPTKNVIERVYRKFSVPNTVLDNGKLGKKIIQFTDRDLTREEKQSVYEEEERLAVEGENVRFSFINVETLRSIPLYFYATASPKEREGSALDRVMFQDTLNQGMAVSQITGAPINRGKLIQRFETAWGAKDFFQTDAPMDMQQTGALPQDFEQQLEGLAGSTAGQQLKAGVAAPNKVSARAAMSESLV